MNMKKYIIAVLGVFAFIFAFDFIVHGKLLADAYMQTAQLWRPTGTTLMEYMLLGQLAIAAAFVYLFTKNYENIGIEEGVRFGTYVGLLLAATQIGTHSYMPIPMSLMVSWVIGSLVMSIGCGVVASLLYKQ